MAVQIIPSGNNGFAATDPDDTYIVGASTLLTNDDEALYGTEGNGARFIIAGMVVSSDTAAVWAAQQFRAATIEIESTGVVSGVVGVRMFAPGAATVNRGAITGTGYDRGQISALGIGVEMVGTSATFLNSGTVEGDNGVLTLSGLIGVGAYTIQNDGVIQGRAVGIYAEEDDTAPRLGTVVIDNTGLISGATAAVYSESQMQIANSGVMRGGIALSGADDAVLNSGAVGGLVSLGAGADIYRGEADGTATEVSGGAGADSLYGSTAADDFGGGNNADTLSGGGGDDSLAGNRAGDRVAGGSGEDSLDGGDGRDVLSGGSDADTVSGGNGLDALAGNAGDDVLDGGSGGDRIVGGSGDDTMTGGSRGDVFVFAPGAGNDVVTDFTAQDRLDVSGFGFSDFAEIEAGIRGTAGGTTIVLDGTTIRLDGVPVGSVDAADFIF